MKMPVISGLEMVKVLHRKGWIAVRQTGSHIIMQKDDVPDEIFCSSAPRIKTRDSTPVRIYRRAD